ncbi:MAG: helix-turn-helix domain-containing protein [Gemmatimonadales bacterium]
MTAIAAVLDSRSALAALRRSLPRGTGPVVTYRSWAGLCRGLLDRLMDAIVIGSRASRKLDLAALRTRFPGIPLVVYGAIRPEDAAQLLAWHRLGVAMVLVEGVDDAMVSDLVLRTGASTARRAFLAQTPRQLRLTEPVQLRAWDRLVAAPGRPPRTSALARDLGLSREHLSRQFGAGGAPNLKRVSDLLTVLSALDLLENPGYQPAAVARLLGFATPSHLRATVRRVAGVPFEEARGLRSGEVVKRFVRQELGS